MAANSPFSQLFVRRDEADYRILGDRSLCAACGDKAICSVPRALDYLDEVKGVDTTVERCRSFIPVISFQDMTGVSGTFNTFRRGLGWRRRLLVRQRIGVLDLACNRRLPDARVVELHAGPLHQMLDDHAAMNHLMRDAPADAARRLFTVLQRLYGRNHAAPGTEFSVVYLEMEKDHGSSQGVGSG